MEIQKNISSLEIHYLRNETKKYLLLYNSDMKYINSKWLLQQSYIHKASLYLIQEQNINKPTAKTEKK